MLHDVELASLHATRDKIVGYLNRALGSTPRIYYGGSYAKGTMIRAAYDLDLVIYYPHTDKAPVSEIFGNVHSSLVRAGFFVQPRTVALRIQDHSGFHVDVVPGRALDGDFRFATLHKNANPPTTLQTSLKIHIDAVRKTGLTQIVKLLKLWRIRQSVPLSTFTLEIIAGRALSSERPDDHAKSLVSVLSFIARHMDEVRLQDPANSNNILDVSPQDRRTSAQIAERSLRGTWSELL